MNFFKKIFNKDSKKEEEKEENFSTFIKELRKEKNLTQYELADLIPISREAVSKWERNTTKPNKASLERLSDIFEVSTDELKMGKRLSNLQKEDLQKLTKDLYKQKLRIKKLLKISGIIIVLLSLLFLGYYFVTSYNSIKVYCYKYETDNLKIRNGIFVTTRKRFYFNVGNIETDKDIISLKLYYKNKQNENIKLYYEEKNFLFIYDNYGYNRYFTYKDLKDVLSNMYLDIEYIDSTETIKLDFYQDFANSLFSKDEKIKIMNNKENNNDNFDFSEELIKQKFSQVNNMYLYENEKENLTASYMDNIRLLNITISANDALKEWEYSFSSNNLVYHEYKNDDEINSYDYNVECNTNCLETKNEFYTIIAKILG